MTAHQIAGDWYGGTIPENVQVCDGAHVETTYSFRLYRSRRELGMILGTNSAAYIGCMFDMGPDAIFQVGAYTLLNGLWLISDQQVTIGTHCLLSWNVVIMDNFRAPIDVPSRRRLLETFAANRHSGIFAPVRPRPVTIGNNVWIGFDCCILPGVRIGDGSIIGARSVVDQDIPDFCIAAGNPARVIRTLRDKEMDVA